jgi:hypothetical protein
MGLTEVFIVRIYRRNRPAGGALVGTVEAVPNRKTQTFESCAELCSLLGILRRPGGTGRRWQRVRTP